MSYKVIDRSSYYRKGVFRHFSEDCKCSLSMTARVDVTDLVAWSRRTGSKFYINFLYVLAKVMPERVWLPPIRYVSAQAMSLQEHRTLR